MIKTEILERNARMFGDEIPLIERIPAYDARSSLTWQAFSDQSNQLARALK